MKDQSEEWELGKRKEERLDPPDTDRHQVTTILKDTFRARYFAPASLGWSLYTQTYATPLRERLKKRVILH